MKVSMKIKGADKLVKEIAKYGEKAEFLVEAETQDAANNIALNAKRISPVDTGRLRGSIQVEKVTSLTYIVETIVKYAKYIEYGTVRMRAQPFLYPSLIRERPKYIKNLKRTLKNLQKK